MLTQANARRKKAGTISTGQLGDHVRTNTIIVVNSMVGYQASFRFTPLATFLTPCFTFWNDIPGSVAYRITEALKLDQHVKVIALCQDVIDNILGTSFADLRDLWGVIHKISFGIS
ncbi:hypothetical protein CLF_111517 [Clonorchis sinensis]|uniref:Uncharacterized protein n=1 Tax=Clonorchis sinensis TaxID=79923 RepID=H2KV85_CLOSI|nr:hypothetical protein CLF_111517 [Clonorchis sinensis]